MIYVETNPVAAGMVQAPEEWLYSSSRHYFSDQEDSLIDLYDRPDYQEALQLSKQISNIKGSVIGSELFQIQAAELLVD